MLALAPGALGVAAYVAPMAVVTASYALFQAANNTAVMRGVRADERGLVAGMLSLSRNLGLVTGTCLMGALFALASHTTDVASARPDSVAIGMRVTYAAAASLVLAAIALVGRQRSDDGGHRVASTRPSR